jgi:hypothetical protein
MFGKAFVYLFNNILSFNYIFYTICYYGCCTRITLISSFASGQNQKKRGRAMKPYYLVRQTTQSMVMSEQQL